MLFLVGGFRPRRVEVAGRFSPATQTMLRAEVSLERAFHQPQPTAPGGRRAVGRAGPRSDARLVRLGGRGARLGSGPGAELWWLPRKQINLGPNPPSAGASRAHAGHEGGAHRVPGAVLDQRLGGRYNQRMFPITEFVAAALVSALAGSVYPLLLRTLRATKRDEERVAVRIDAESPGDPEAAARAAALESALKVVRAESPLTRELVTSLERSKGLAERVNQRAGLQFAWGAALSVVGLVGFGALIWLSYLTTISAPPVQAPGWSEVAASALPRVALVVSVEVLAGYFLRLHRITMADFHRYELVVQQRELLVAAARWIEGDKSVPAHLRNELFRLLVARPGLELIPDGHRTESAEAEASTRNDVVEAMREGSGAAGETIKALVGGKPNGVG